jgi:fermentation-respiration switch protein FrsA (DUF1100 family)
VRRRARVAVAATAAVVVAAAWIGSCGASVSEPISLRLTGATELPAPPGERLREVRFEDADGREVMGVLREPAAPGGPMAAVILVAGRETGREAAAVIEGPVEEVVLALEYPAALPETFSLRGALLELPAVRRTALRMPGLLRGAARWLAEQERVDPERMILVGVSYGVPFAAPAGADPLFSGVALHHGGADLALLLRSNLMFENGLLRRAVARVGAWYFRALDPGRHVGRIAPTPLLLINAEHDELVPRESALRLLEAARPPVRLIWLPYGHLMPGDVLQMEELADSTLAHFRFLRP